MKQPKAVLDSKDFRKLVKLLISKHTPDKFDLLSYYKIDPSHVITGMICPTCSYSPMVKNNSVWLCGKCGCKSKTAHLDALKDYKLLFGNTIKNNELRWFLQINSTSVASKILTSLNLRSEGRNKGRLYYLD